MNYTWIQAFVTIIPTLYLSQNYPNIIRCPENFLMMPVSQKSIDTNKNLSDLVKEEAINICENKIWPSFLCVLVLASVTSRKINCYYPDIGGIRYRTLFNCIIQSRIPQISCNWSVTTIKSKWFKFSNPVCAIKFCCWSVTFLVTFF